MRVAWVWGIRRDRGNIKPHNRSFTWDRVAHLDAVRGNARALLGLHRITVARNDEAQLAGREVIDQGAAADLADVGPHRQQRILRSPELAEILAVGRLAE